MLIGWSYLIISIPRVCFCFYRIYIKSVLSCWFLRQQISHLVSPTTNIPPAFSANIYKSSLDFVAVHILDTFKEAFKLVDNTFTTNDFSNQFTLKTLTHSLLSPNLHILLTDCDSLALLKFSFSMEVVLTL